MLALRALVVEDSPDDAELIILEMSRSGIEAVWKRVESAEEVRAALTESSWDVVLSDYNLPGFGAREALVQLREIDPDLPFIVVSGTIGEEQAVAMMRAGAADYLLKGNLTRLGAAVEREIREAASRRARRAAELLAQDVLDSLSSRRRARRSGHGPRGQRRLGALRGNQR